MAFKLFKEYGAASRTTATLRVSGSVFLASGILKRCKITEPLAAKLYFDEEHCHLGIELLNAYDKADSTQKEMSVEKSGRSVNILALLRYYGLVSGRKLSARLSLPAKFDDGMLVLDLSQLKSVAVPAP